MDAKRIVEILRDVNNSSVAWEEQSKRANTYNEELRPYELKLIGGLDTYGQPDGIFSINTLEMYPDEPI